MNSFKIFFNMGKNGNMGLIEIMCLKGKRPPIFYKVSM
jgi:hypothetical protein